MCTRKHKLVCVRILHNLGKFKFVTPKTKTKITAWQSNKRAYASDVFVNTNVRLSRGAVLVSVCGNRPKHRTSRFANSFIMAGIVRPTTLVLNNNCLATFLPRTIKINNL
jgi:hypothetical protein